MFDRSLTGQFLYQKRQGKGERVQIRVPKEITERLIKGETYIIQIWRLDL
jgi:hypothetical protein